MIKGTVHTFRFLLSQWMQEKEEKSLRVFTFSIIYFNVENHANLRVCL